MRTATVTTTGEGSCCCGDGPCCLDPSDPDFPMTLNGDIDAPGCVFDGPFTLTHDGGVPGLWLAFLPFSGGNCSIEISVGCSESGPTGAPGLYIDTFTVGGGAVIGGFTNDDAVASCNPLFFQAPGSFNTINGCCAAGTAATLTITEP